MRGSWKRMVIVACLVVLTGAATPATAGGHEEAIATGHIEVGVIAAHAFMTNVIGLPPSLGGLPWTFAFDPSAAAGEWVETRVTDNGGTGYAVRLYFYDEAQQSIEATCLPSDDSNGLLDEPNGELVYREHCLVPADARLAILAADVGALLDVQILRAA